MLKFKPFHPLGYEVKALDFVDRHWVTCYSDMDISVGKLLLTELYETPNHNNYYANGISYDCLYEKIKLVKPDLTTEEFEGGLRNEHLIFWNTYRNMIYPDPGGC